MGRRKLHRSEAELAQMRLAKNARRRIARMNDPTYLDRHKHYQQAYDDRNREREQLRKRAWIESNPDQRRINRHARRAAERSAPGYHSRSHVRAIMKAQNHACAYCQETSDLHLDHAIPLIRGGSNWPWNLQWLCSHHNIAKGAKTDAEYRREIGLPVVVWESLRTWSAALNLAPEILSPLG